MAPRKPPAAAGSAPDELQQLRDAVRASDAMRARAAESAQQARAAAALLVDETRALQAELDAVRAEADARLQEMAADNAALAAGGSAAVRRMLRESQLRENRLQEQVTGLQSELQRLIDERGRLLSAAAPAGDLELILGSGLFDGAWYRARYADAAESGMDPALHFVRIGLNEGRDPGPHFDCAAYLSLHPDVAASGVNPLLHYLNNGAAEGRALPRPAAALAVPSAPVQGATTLVIVSGEPETPGHVYRVARFAEAARVAGVQVHILPMADVADRIDRIASADIVMLWRAPWGSETAGAVAAARAGAARLVFDIDDLMVDPDLATESVIDGIRSQGLQTGPVREHYTRVRTTMAQADFCLATTDELARHMRKHAKPAAVLPNGYDSGTWRESRRAVRMRQSGPDDALLRIGYAGGSRTHQRDFAQAAPAVARALADRPDCRLVLFRMAAGGQPLVDMEEFPEFAALQAQIEWRDLVTLEALPYELARLDINIVPLEIGNPFCEAKSELKFFEAALVEVPTIASATGPFQRAIVHGRTGLLAAGAGDWDIALNRLLDDAGERRRIGRAAYLDVLWPFGPEARAQQVAVLLDQMKGGRAAAAAFELSAHRAQMSRQMVSVPDSETLFLHDALGFADVTVVVPLYNYAQFIEEALDSVRAQTLAALDLIVIDDCSTDNGLAVVLAWVQRHRSRFNRIEVRRNVVNAGLGPSRNAGFAAAETPFVLPLDADNRLRPRCCKRLLTELRAAGAAFAYPVIRQFGEASGRLGTLPYAPARLAGVPYIDAMALVSVAAWAGAGGYSDMRLGWEDYDFWCKLAERGLHGIQVAGEPLAEYRVHSASMLRSITETGGHKPVVLADMARRHPWLSLADAPPPPPPQPVAPLPEAGIARLQFLLPLLRCPVSGQRLHPDAALEHLISDDGVQRWPLVAGRPVLDAGNLSPRIVPSGHVSNPLPESAQEVIRTADGPVLNLSAGGTAGRPAHVIEIEAAIFRNTDAVADAHRLPFADGVFAAVIVLNAFEHYRDPRAVAAEIFRVLRPGGQVLVQTAFLQPMHEAPHHYFNCTRHGLEAWFEGFETSRLHVSENFGPAYALSWLAHEVQSAVSASYPAAIAQGFAATPVSHWAGLWTAPEGRAADPSWLALQGLPQPAQDVVAAGFEYLGRRPLT